MYNVQVNKTFTKMMLEVGIAVFTNTSAKSIETRQLLYDKANHTEVAYIEILVT